MTLNRFIKSRATKCLSILLVYVYTQVFVLGDIAYGMSPATTGSSTSGSFKASSGSPSPMELFQVDTFTGAFTTGVNIFTLPGRKGIEPKITLSYNSSGPNSWLGIGWGLGFGSISRSTKKGVPKYDDMDTFILSFQGVSSELVEIAPNEYRTKDEALFLKIEKISDHWKVTDKSGTQYWFGENTSARQVNSLGIFAWMFEKVEDTNGNYMDISYFQDEGALYPSQIRYTGNSNGYAPQHTIDFILDGTTRPDQTISYNSGDKILIKQRLKKIEVKVSGVIVRRYVLDYTQSPLTNRSLLTSVTEYGVGGNNPLPPVTFNYQSLDLAFEETENWFNIENLGDENLGYIHHSHTGTSQESTTDASIIDLNGDGLPDRVLQDSGTSTTWKVQLNRGGDFSKYTNWNNVDTSRGSWIRKSNSDFEAVIDIADMNGDGRPDRIIKMGAGVWNIQFNNGTGFDSPSVWTGIAGSNGLDSIRKSEQSGVTNHTLAELNDINGDGLPDRIFQTSTSNTYWDVQLNNGNGFDPPTQWNNVEELQEGARRIRQTRSENQTSVDLFDINGDGLPDRVYREAGGSVWKVQFNNGKSFENSTVWDSGVEYLNEDLLRYINYARADGPNKFITELDIMDINGDGLPDRVLQDEAYGDTWKIQLNNGTGFEPVTNWSNVNVIPNAWVKTTETETSDGESDQKVRSDLFDLNGDGLPDRVIQYPDHWKVQLCEGEARDLMVGIHNGRGGSSAIKYKSSNQYDNTGDDNTSDLPFPVVTVTQVTSDDGLGNQYTTRYEYEGGLYDTDDREFRGFAHVTVLDPTYIARHFWHAQDPVFKGKVTKEELRNAGGVLFSKTESLWDVTAPYPSFPDIQFVFAKETNNYIFDGDATLEQIRSEFAYDQYGNLTRTIEHGDVSIIGDERTTVNEFAYNTSDWILNALSKTTLYDENNVRCSEKYYYYDGAITNLTPPTIGNLTKEEEWLDTAVSSTDYPTTQMTYDSYGNILTITDANNNVTTNTYDPVYNKFLITIENAQNRTTSFTYDARYAQILSTTDQNGVTESSVYDEFGRLVKSIGPNDSLALPAKEIFYNIGSPITMITTQLRVNHGQPEVMTSYAFIDGMGRTIQTRSPAEESGKQIVSGGAVYNERGQKEKEYYPYLDNFSSSSEAVPIDTPFVTYSYDTIARQVKTTYADNTFSEVLYDDFVTTQTDPLGNQKRSTVDAYGRTVLIEEFNEGDIYETQYIYDCRGNLIKTIDNLSNESILSYDSLSRKTSMNDPDMGLWSYEYDKNGNLVSQTDAIGNAITFVYDSLNRITLKDYPIGQQDVVYTYDTTSVTEWIPDSLSKGKLTKITDASGSTEMAYDNQGRVNKLRKTVESITYDFTTTFDALGRKKSVSITKLGVPTPEIISYGYNLQGELEMITSSVDGPIVTNVDYNASSQMERVDYGNGTFTTYQYDDKTFRLTNLKTYSGGVPLQDLNYTFDSVGNVLQIDDNRNNAVQKFTYDGLNRLSTAQGTYYGTKTYEYDSIGNMLKKGALSMNYGNNAGPHAVTSSSDERTFEYDANGSMIKRGVDVLTYDFDQKLKEIVVKKADRESVVYDLQPGWNTIAFPSLPEDKSIANVLADIWDQFDQISRYDPVTDEWTHFVKNAEYDEFDTLDYGLGYEIYITDIAVVNFALDGYDIPGDQVISLSAGDNLIGPSIDSAMTVSELLSMVSGPSTVDSVRKWDPLSQNFTILTGSDTILPGEAVFVAVDSPCSLTLVKTANTVQFAYDANGTRVKKMANGATTTYIGENIVIAPDGVVKKHISLNGIKIFTSESDGDRYFTHTDHINSSNIVTDASGAEVEQIEYSPYGQTVKQTGTDVVDHKFTGYEEDDETGLYYARARYYDAQLGRFITADPTIQHPFDPQDFNRYAYARNNPINFIDPSGYGWLSSLIGAIVGAIVTVLTGGLGAPLAGALGGMVGGALSGGLNGGWSGALVGAGLGFVGGAIGGFAASSGWELATYGFLIGGAAFSYATGGLDGLASFGVGLAGGYIGNQLGQGFATQIQARAGANPHEAQNRVDGKDKAAVTNKKQQDQTLNKNSPTPDRQRYNSADHDYIRYKTKSSYSQSRQEARVQRNLTTDQNHPVNSSGDFNPKTFAIGVGEVVLGVGEIVAGYNYAQYSGGIGIGLGAAGMMKAGILSIGVGLTDIGNSFYGKGPFIQQLINDHGEGVRRFQYFP